MKDFLRELPEPLFTNALYQMLLDALSVRMPGDPDGSAKLMLSILECLPKANQVSSHSLNSSAVSRISEDVLTQDFTKISQTKPWNLEAS